MICSFANNAGLCGVGLGSCTQDSKKGTKAGIIVAIIVAVIMVLTGGFVYWKRKANIARAQRLRELSNAESVTRLLIFDNFHYRFIWVILEQFGTLFQAEGCETG